VILQDKVVVIIGAGLLGRAFVGAAIGNGAKVVIADIDLERARCVIEELRRDGTEALAAVSEQVDITSAESLDRLIADVERRHGKIDAVVNNAYPRNKHYGRKLEDVAYADFCENVDLHLGGFFLSMQRFALFFRRQGFGHVIGISSIYGVVAPRFDIYADTSMNLPVEYAAIKSALQHVTVYFMRYFKGTRLRFNCIAPGGILDGQPANFVAAYNRYSQQKGMLDADDVAGTLVFLLSDLSAAINGQTLVVDDGWSA
jgi:NAD(P)-dependent dehydrogenase (short-subunit alcohol dehydrogenase family)